MRRFVPLLFLGCTSCASIYRVPRADLAEIYRPKFASTGELMVPLTANPSGPAAAGAAGCLAPGSLTDGITYVVSGRRLTVPVGFNRIERSEDNSYRVGSAVNFGVGISWFGGTGTYSRPGDPDKASLEITPSWYWGIAASGGVRDDLFDTTADIGGSASLGVFAGIRDFGLTAGYDFAGRVGFVGIAAKIDAFSIKRGTGGDVCVQREAW